MDPDLEAHLQGMRDLMSMAGPLPAEHWQELSRHVRLIRLRRGDHFIRAGEKASTIAFVAAGLLRLYYAREDGKVFNKSFVGSPDFVSAHESLISGEPSRLSIDAIEPATLLVLEYAKLSSFYDRDIAWQRLARVFTELLYVKKARKEAALLMDSAAERYATFLVEYGHFESRIPDYHIASYLGITPEALSRLKPAVLRDLPR